jgi:hypothetical protein
MLKALQAQDEESEEGRKKGAGHHHNHAGHHHNHHSGGKAGGRAAGAIMQDRFVHQESLSTEIVAAMHPGIKSQLKALDSRHRKRMRPIKESQRRSSSSEAQLVDEPLSTAAKIDGVAV